MSGRAAEGPDRARGDARPDSDFDLGVVIDCPAALEVYHRLANACAPWIPPDRLQVVILNEAPPLLRHRVLRDGRCLAARSEEIRVAWEVAAVREFWDTARWRELDRPGARRPPRIDAEAFLAAARRAGEILNG